GIDDAALSDGAAAKGDGIAVHYEVGERLTSRSHEGRGISGPKGWKVIDQVSRRAAGGGVSAVPGLGAGIETAEAGGGFCHGCRPCAKWPSILSSMGFFRCG